MARFCTLLLVMLMLSCVHSHRISEGGGEVLLSNIHPESNLIKARLVDIAKDGTTTIFVLPTGRTLSASVGGYFISEEYGQIGLQLISASAEKHEAKFMFRFAK